jgi:hypothetical protein
VNNNVAFSTHILCHEKNENKEPIYEGIGAHLKSSISVFRPTLRSNYDPMRRAGTKKNQASSKSCCRHLKSEI